MSNIEFTHCQSCGGREQATAENEGYSDCCNERIVYTQGPNVWGQPTTCESNGDCSHE